MVTAQVVDRAGEAPGAARRGAGARAGELHAQGCRLAVMACTAQLQGRVAPGEEERIAAPVREEVHARIALAAVGLEALRQIRVLVSGRSRARRGRAVAEESRQVPEGER